MSEVCADARQAGFEERWRAIMARDGARDGEFIFAVRTTGIYCRPSCPSRRPKRENVAFYELNREAEAAGFRPCRRCRPHEPSRTQENALAVEAACRRIEQSEVGLGLDALAEGAGMSRFHFHRVFKLHTGLTPKQYARALSDARVRERLQPGTTATEAIHEAGYPTAARFYERAVAVLGMSPTEYRKRGKNQTIWYAFATSSLGRVLVAGTARGLCFIRFGETEKGP